VAGLDGEDGSSSSEVCLASDIGSSTCGQALAAWSADVLAEA
jgi:hypothetical protein